MDVFEAFDVFVFYQQFLDLLLLLVDHLLLLLQLFHHLGCFLAVLLLILLQLGHLSLSLLYQILQIFGPQLEIFHSFVVPSDVLAQLLIFNCHFVKLGIQLLINPQSE